MSEDDLIRVPAKWRIARGWGISPETGKLAYLETKMAVIHCPFCHGWEVRDQPLGVLDQGAHGVLRSLLLRLWSDDVTLFTTWFGLLNPLSKMMMAAVLSFFPVMANVTRGLSGVDPAAVRARRVHREDRPAVRPSAGGARRPVVLPRARPAHP